MRTTGEAVAEVVASAPPAPGPSLAVVIPATDRPPTLGRAIAAVRPCLRPGDELVVVTEPRGAGPAAARNAGAHRARADVLVFVDSDVVVHPDALRRLRAAFAADPGLTAAFGSYDDGPSSRGLVSQFRNLLHHHVHQRHAGVAFTFWSGLGAVRRAAFLVAGGFDPDRFPMPAVEDVDLGMRLRATGARIELRPDVQGTHLKHWTLRDMIRTDFHRRGVPWVVMSLERRSLPRTLNLSGRERASAVTMVWAAGGALRRRPAAARRGTLVLALLDGPFLWLLFRRMGPLRAVPAVGLHALHRVVALAALPTGALAYVRGRRA